MHVVDYYYFFVWFKILQTSLIFYFPLCSIHYHYPREREIKSDWFENV